MVVNCWTEQWNLWKLSSVQLFKKIPRGHYFALDNWIKIISSFFLSRYLFNIYKCSVLWYRLGSSAEIRAPKLLFSRSPKLWCLTPGLVPLDCRRDIWYSGGGGKLAKRALCNSALWKRQFRYFRFGTWSQTPLVKIIWLYHTNFKQR